MTLSVPESMVYEHGHSGRGVHVVVRNTSRIFEGKRGSVVACEDVSLEARPGEFLVIVGPSGCGKSTLLCMIAGLDKPTSGLITTTRSDGQPPTNSMVFHGRTLFPWLTLRANIAYGPLRHGASKIEARARADELLELVGLRDFGRSWPHQVSEGMRQRVSLARALATNPSLLLMDEPFGALDEQTRYILQEELLRIWQDTCKTVIFVTHSIEEALMLGDRVLVMTARPGRIAKEVIVPFGRPRDLGAVRSNPEFGPLFEDIWGTLREEVERGGAFS
ncbi:MAG: ABC transporter ATP-binding protein [Thermomicrobiales bacterium]|nr:ABC transporter ATP-binding protein [Thermomicrobiales bacterium]